MRVQNLNVHPPHPEYATGVLTPHSTAPQGIWRGSTELEAQSRTS